jgi:hypothetical protein
MSVFRVTIDFCTGNYECFYYFCMFSWRAFEWVWVWVFFCVCKYFGRTYCDLQNKWESLRRSFSSKMVQISRWKPLKILIYFASRSIMLYKYHAVQVSCCTSIMLYKYHAVQVSCCTSIMLFEYVRVYEAVRMSYVFAVIQSLFRNTYTYVLHIHARYMYIHNIWYIHIYTDWYIYILYCSHACNYTRKM